MEHQVQEEDASALPAGPRTNAPHRSLSHSLRLAGTSQHLNAVFCNACLTPFCYRSGSSQKAAAAPQVFPGFLSRHCPRKCNGVQRKYRNHQKRPHIGHTKNHAAFHFKLFCSCPALSQLLPGRCLSVSLKPVQTITCSYCMFQNLTLLTMISPLVAMAIAILPSTGFFFTAEVFWQTVCF